MDESEEVVLKAWQELCFKMISAVREFYAPGTTEELSMPRYIRDLGKKAQEYDRIKVGCADMRDLLIEFQNNPNIELGEVGHAKIEAVLSRLEQ